MSASPHPNPLNYNDAEYIAAHPLDSDPRTVEIARDTLDATKEVPHLGGNMPIPHVKGRALWEAVQRAKRQP